MHEWMNDLPEELQDNATLQQYKTRDEALKGLVETKSMLGNAIRIPGENAAEEDRQAFLEKLTAKVPELMKRPDDDDPEFWETFGTPKEASEYQVPEGVTLPDGSEAVLREVMLEAKLSKRQAERMLQAMSKRGQEVTQQTEAQKSESEKALRSEWGAAYDDRMKAIKALESKFDLATPQGRYALAKSLMGGGAEFAAQPETSTAVSPSEAQAQIAEIDANPAYWDRSDPRQQSLVKRRMELLKFAYPGISDDPQTLRSVR
jgi:hypothetical protein